MSLLSANSYHSKHNLIILAANLLILFVSDSIEVFTNKPSIILLLPARLCTHYLLNTESLRRQDVLGRGECETPPSIFGNYFSDTLSPHLLRCHRSLDHQPESQHVRTKTVKVLDFSNRQGVGLTSNAKFMVESVSLNK